MDQPANGELAELLEEAAGIRETLDLADQEEFDRIIRALRQLQRAREALKFMRAYLEDRNETSGRAWALMNEVLTAIGS